MCHARSIWPLAAPAGRPVSVRSSVLAGSVITARAPRGDTTDGARIDRSPGTLEAHREDAAHFAGGHAEGVARPRTEQDVARLLTAAMRVLPVGAQSSLTGGATPAGGLVLSTVRFSDIHDAGRHEVRVGAGVALQTLQDLLHQQGRWYAPTPTYTGASAGGVVATNAAGASTFKYGTTRDWTTGATVVLSCGHVLDLRRGETVADADRRFVVTCPCGTRTVRHGSYRMPDVPKVSAGYFAQPGMDLLDLFIGAEGTLGVLTDVTFRVQPEPPAVAWALVPVATEAGGLALVGALRTASRQTWRTADAEGLDVAAIEHVDRRCLDLLREDGADRKHDITIPEGTDLMLLVQLELAPGTTARDGFTQAQCALAADAPDTAIVRFLRVLDAHEALDDTQVAWPDEHRRIEQFLAFREAVPAGVNRRVGDAKRDVDSRIDKTAADMVVPFEHLGELLQLYRTGYAARGLDAAIWGHISDGNLHPNVIPRSYADVEAGRDAILEFGRAVAALGGCPLAEHGVGRSTVKQALLRQLYGDAGLGEMQAVKAALDPDWRLAPGVILRARPT